MSDAMTASLETASPSPSTSAGADSSFEALFDTALDSVPTLESTPTDASSEPTTEPLRSDRGDGRDDKGRFAPRTAAEQAAASATQTQPGQAPPASRQTTPNPTEQPSSPTPESAPFRYRAMAQTHELPESTMDKDGNVTIKAASVPRLREALNAFHASGHVSGLVDQSRQEIATLRQQLQETRESRTLSDQKAESLLNLLTGIMNNPNDQAALTQLYQLKQQWPTLTAKAEAEFYRSQAERHMKAETPAAPPADAEVVTTAPSRDQALKVTTDHLDDLLVEQQFGDLTEADWQQFRAAVDRKPYAYLRPATAEEAQQYGVRPNQIVFDKGAFQSDVAAYAASVRSARETAATQARRAADQARRTTPTIDAPPTASGTHAPPKGERRITSKADWEEWANSDDI